MRLFFRLDIIVGLNIGCYENILREIKYTNFWHVCFYFFLGKTPTSLTFYRIKRYRITNLTFLEAFIEQIKRNSKLRVLRSLTKHGQKQLNEFRQIVLVCLNLKPVHVNKNRTA